MMIMTIQEIGEVVKEEKEIKAEPMAMMTVTMIVILEAPFREGGLAA